MKSLDFSRCALSCVALAILAGCGGSQPPIGAPGAMPQSRIAARSHNDYDITGPLLYVTNIIYNEVTVYHASAKDPAPIATVSQGLNGPAGVCVDNRGTLYVTNEPASNGGWVAEYQLGKTTPSERITKGIDGAAYCAIDSRGNLWLTNIGGRNVTEYLYGSKRPHTAITKDLSYPTGIAIDSSDNLYVSNRLRTGGDVVVFPHGSKTPSRIITDGVTSCRAGNRCKW
jgi:serine/threonine protein kinase, bacterial